MRRIAPILILLAAGWLTPALAGPATGAEARPGPPPASMAGLPDLPWRVHRFDQGSEIASRRTLTPGEKKTRALWMKSLVNAACSDEIGFSASRATTGKSSLAYAREVAQRIVEEAEKEDRRTGRSPIQRRIRDLGPAKGNVLLIQSPPRGGKGPGSARLIVPDQPERGSVAVISCVLVNKI